MLTLPLIIAKLSYIEKALSIINKVKELFQNTTNKSAIIENSEDAKAIVDLIKNFKEIKISLSKHPEFAKAPLIEEFLKRNKLKIPDFYENYSIIKNDGKCYIITKEIEKQIFSKIRETEENESNQKINVIPLENVTSFDEYKNTEKNAEKAIVEISNELNTKFKSLIALSIHVEDLFKQKRLEEAEYVKSTISKRYDKFGLKFCNLYMRGYLKSLLNSIYKKQQEHVDVKIDEEITSFIENETADIYFIYTMMSNVTVDSIIQKMKGALNNGSSYVAIHSLESSRPLAMKMVDYLRRVGIDESRYNVKEIKEKKEGWISEFSVIWYKGDGINTYSLIK